MSYRRALGDEGEEIACRYLQKKGYTIRERQWRSKIGEIDIIAEKDGVFIFVEVKTRRSATFGYPEEAVTYEKQRHLLRTTELYCALHRIHSLRRIDVMAITLGGKEPHIVHLEDAVGGA